MSSQPFNKNYSQLNPNQKLAVDTTEGPLMVIAGPGTGKTQVLTLRIANILRKHDISPDSIIALTFTEAATQEMRRRLIDLIGQAGYFVQISTFHSFCQSVIMENPDRFIINETTQQLTDLERVQIIQDIITQNSFELIKPLNAPFLYLKAILSSLQNLKREGITPSKFKQTLKQEQQALDSSDISKTQLKSRQRDLDKNLELLKVYRLYQRRLQKRGRFDFEDMINLVTEKFTTDSDLLLSYQEKINYILVDEYQDTNSSQNQLVFKLASYWKDKANLFVVGDPHQSIFRFQGASLENTKQFIDHFPQATLINLDLNYRSTQTILDSAHQLITSSPSKNPLTSSSQLKSKTKLKNQPVHLAEFTHSIFEDAFIIQDIKKKITAGVRPKDIAVIARYNQDLIDFSQSLKKAGIPFVIQGGGDVLETPLIKQLILLLTVIHQTPHQHTDNELFTLLNLDFLHTDPFQVLKFAKQASDSHQHLATFALSLPPKKFPQISKFFLQLSHWQKESANKTLLDFLQTLFQESGFLNHLLKQPDSIHQLNILNTFFDQAKAMSYAYSNLNLTSFLDNLHTLQQQSVRVPLQPLDINSDTVTLTTAHKAKGLEWSNVYIYRCADKKWGNSRSYQLLKLPSEILEFHSTEDPNQEERRLFYVSFTRSKQNLTITSSSQYQTDTGTRPSLPSLFISDLPPSGVRHLKTTTFENKNKNLLKEFFSPSDSQNLPSSEKKYLQAIIQEFKLSVTALNTYLDCPYKFKLNNLYRIPRTKETYLAFGTAVHQALEDFHSRYQQTKRLPSKKYFLTQFEKALQKEILIPEEYKSRLKYGQKVLGDYYDFHQDDFKPAFKVESHFGYSAYSKCYLDDIPLIGKVDRIDKHSSTNTVNIIDYKTGAPKTKGQIAGTTKDSTGSLKRQLVFYQLLSQLDKRFPHSVNQVELDFVEAPHKKQKSGRTPFKISPQEVTKLKKTIKETMSQIRAFNFSRTQDYSHCQRCEFRDHCWPNGIPQNKPSSK